MFRSRSWFGGGGRDSSGGLWKPKNPHSLEYLKYLQGVLFKNQVVSESNKSLLVETLRSIAEILIWGDQNDSTVFDFFLEKNMLSYFLQIMKQGQCGSYVCVQLLQTLNILFENIRNETSLYYLLSNNHVNSIIEHKFDFSDEEVMAYYISFLKTLSFKLNSHTIHFFYNEHTHDFPLYTEAIKFFNNSESMVRIAVRTLTLNVYKVDDKSMLEFIRDKTAAPYFSNLVWFIGNHVVEIDQAIKKCRNDDEQQKNNNCRLDDLVAEHLDHLHYVNDILLLGIEDLNLVLVDHLLNRLFLPVYLGGIEKDRVKNKEQQQQDHLSVVLSLFLLSQVFMIVTHWRLLESLSDSLLQNNILELIDCTENDYGTFYALTLVWAVFKRFQEEKNSENNNETVQLLFYNGEGSVNEEFVRRIISNVVSNAVKFDSKVRLVTVSMATRLLLLILQTRSVQLADRDLALLESHREENILTLQNYYKTEEMFLEIFEDEYLCGRDYSLENLLQDSTLLLPPAGSPLSFVAIDRRRPCGEGERCRRSMRVYFILRSLSLELRNEPEKHLPLTNTQQCVGIEQNLDLTNSDLLACTVLCRLEGTKLRRFLVVDSFQLILVEPSHKRMGWGVVKFVGFLQDLEVLGDPNDSRCLHITVKSSPVSLIKKIKEAKNNNGKCNVPSSAAGAGGPILAAKFMFDDHIRCMAAKQRLVKGRHRARETKLIKISRLLDQQQQKPASSSSPPQRIRNFKSGNRMPGVAVPSIQSTSTSTESNSRRRRSPKTRSIGQVVVSEIPLEERQTTSGSGGAIAGEEDGEEPKLETTSFVSAISNAGEEEVVHRKKGDIMDV